MAAGPSVQASAGSDHQHAPTGRQNGSQSHAAGSVGTSPGRRSRDVANSAAALDLQDARSKRFRLLDRLQGVTSLDRLSHCRRHPHGQAEFVGIVSRDGVSSYDGLQTCGSVWSCPVDSAKVRHQRTLDLARVVLDHLDAGGGLAFPTMTLAHRSADPLADTLGHVMAGWRYVTGHRRYRELRAELGIEHVCKSVEVTHGLNGWHPHIHALMFSREPLGRKGIERLRETLWDLWSAYAAAHDLRLLVEHRAVVVKGVAMTSDAGVAALAEYLFKVQDGYGIAAEIVRADLKSGRAKRSRVPFQIAESATRPGVAGAGKSRRDLDLWLEYETATKGRRVMDWTKGSAAALGLDDLPDDVVAARADDGDLVYDLTPYEWSLVVRYRRRGHVLNVADSAGAQGVSDAIAALRRRDRYEAARAARRG
jgi:hypothetical protein